MEMMEEETWNDRYRWRFCPKLDTWNGGTRLDEKEDNFNHHLWAVVISISDCQSRGPGFDYQLHIFIRYHHHHSQSVLPKGRSFTASGET